MACLLLILGQGDFMFFQPKDLFVLDNDALSCQLTDNSVEELLIGRPYCLGAKLLFLKTDFQGEIRMILGDGLYNFLPRFFKKFGVD